MQHEPDGRIDFGATPFRRFGDKSADQNINGVLSGLKWRDLELTYSFPDSKRDYGPNYPDDNKDTPDFKGPVGTFKEFTDAQVEAAEYWLDQYASVSQLSFVLLDGRSGAQDEDQEATLRFAFASVVVYAGVRYLRAPRPAPAREPAPATSA